MKNATLILDELRQIRRSGYGRELPDVSDSKFIELAEQYAQCDEATREAIREHVEDDTRLLLLGFSDRLAIVAERTKNMHLLTLALIAHSIEDFRYDERENLFRLALVNHVAERLRVPTANLFDSVARLSSSRAAMILANFRDRPAEMKSLRTMRIVEESTSDGVSYRYA